MILRKLQMKRNNILADTFHLKRVRILEITGCFSYTPLQNIKINSSLGYACKIFSKRVPRFRVPAHVIAPGQYSFSWINV